MKKFLVITASVLALLLAWSLPSADAADGFKVVVNSANDVSEISKKELSALMLKKRSKWPGSDLKVDPVDLVTDSPVREAFSKLIHGRSTSGIESFWQRQIFSGKGVPPTKVANDSDVIDHVKENPGGIGYVSPNASVDGVKVVAIVN